MARASRKMAAPILISFSCRQVSDQAANRAMGGKGRDAVVSGFGTFRKELRKGLDRFRTVMALV